MQPQIKCFLDMHKATIAAQLDQLEQQKTTVESIKSNLPGLYTALTEMIQKELANA